MYLLACVSRPTNPYRVLRVPEHAASGEVPRAYRVASARGDRGKGAFWRSGTHGSVGTFDELDAIAKRVIYKAAMNLGHFVVPAHGDTGLGEVVDESVQGTDHDGRVCFPRGAEVSFDAHMELHTVSTEPSPATHSESRWLRENLEAEDACVELLGLGLPALRDGQLDVVESLDGERHPVPDELSPRTSGSAAETAPRMARACLRRSSPGLESFMPRGVRTNSAVPSSSSRR